MIGRTKAGISMKKKIRLKKRKCDKDLQASGSMRSGIPERIIMSGYAAAVFTAVLFTQPCLAADDPLTVVNNLSTFIFSLIRAIGLILLGFGIMQVGLSLKSHDPAQRANGFLTLAGGIIVTFTKEILTLITG